MNNIAFRILFAGILLTAAVRASALPFNAVDPRSLAMGGTGVASATGGNASFYNPGLLSAPFNDDHFGLELPIVKAEYYDPDNFRRAAQDFNDANYVSDLANAIDAYNAAPTPSAPDAQAVVNSATRLISGLQSVSDRPMQLDVNAAFVVAKPDRKLGLSLYVNTWVLGGGVGHFTSQDNNLILGIISDAKAGKPQIQDPQNFLTSSVEIRLAAISEIGVSVAKDISFFGHDIAMGITPKFVRVQTYDYRFTGAQLDNASISLGEGKRIESNVNMDLGLAKAFGNGWRAGFAVKNLFTQTYKTALGNELTVSPQARVGVVHHNGWSTVAADLDLTENDRAGFDAKTRYLGVGAEFDAWHDAQLRVGYRYNVADSKTSIFTGGVGISPFGIHLDLAIAGNPHEIAAALQTGYRF